ncbi:hypothetical protein QQ020_18095 [Fulvivirgaceae bacterium BMA12]|uniref:Beta-mannosidase B n=1 Tax=Agaribacillus aureus TaxID=3051825 RepID=A0ABT8LCG0_9BACT|nr:hypothetical protein [Fulvivirgaceae bacterium BMA12]
MTNQSRNVHIEQENATTGAATEDIKYLATGWKFKEEGTDSWYHATVPGCNFTDLLSNELIGDPFYRDNEEHLQWIEKKDWVYETDFIITAAELDHARIELVCKGLDTYATIYLNDREIASNDNQFVECVTEVRPDLVVGKNKLRIHFHSPIAYVREKAEKVGITYPAGNDHSDDKLSVFSRKAPYHFGWDWGPRFVTSGIWRPVFLKFIKNINIVDSYFKPEIISENKAVIHVSISLTAHEKSEAKLTISCLNEALNTTNHIAFLEKGHNEVKIKFSVNNYKKWWPRGFGEAHLYHFAVNIKDHHGSTCSIFKKVGIRKIEVINKPDEHGESFYFQVNGVPVFAKGANYIPQDSFLTRVSEERYHQLYADVLAANMNMIRVWGGGIYEDDLFYDLADQHGILVWQDFMFACTLYPGDASFLQNVEKEAISNIKRLRGHASIALWCGNNEVRVGWHHWGWQEEYNYSKDDQQWLFRDYKQLFEKLLPEVVAEHDPERFYFPSSPISNFEEEKDFSVGDVHYWGVWHKEAPFSDYEKCVPRFMSEYGFQSFPIFESVKKYTLAEDWDINSPVMKLHQKHPRGNQLIKDYLLQDYNEARDFESFLYLSQILQAHGIKIAIEAHRRNKPYCMGSLYWQLNDCWPVASWSGIDYYGRWKALHYFVKKAFKDILLSCKIADDHLSTYLISDRLENEKGRLYLQILTLDGEVVTDLKEEVELKANTSYLYKKHDLKGLIGSNDIHNLVIYAGIEIKNELMSENIYYLVPTKDLMLRKPAIKYSVKHENDQLKVLLQSDVLVKNLYLRFDGLSANFSDNFFDLMPKREKEVTLPFASTYNGNIPKLKMTSVVDTY